MPSDNPMLRIEAQDYIIQGLIAIISKLHPNANIASELHEYVKQQVDALTISGLSDGDVQRLKGEVLGAALNNIVRDSNASKF